MASFKFNNSSKQKGNGGCGLIVFGVIWTLFSSFFLYFGVNSAISDAERSGWPSTPCEIQQFEIKDSRNSDDPFSIVTRFTYVWKFQEYTSTKAWVEEHGKEDYIDLTDELTSYQESQIKHCYVNPDNPSEAVLFTNSGDSWGSYVFAIFGGCFVAIGISLIVYGIRSKGAAKKALSSRATRSGEGKGIIIPFFGLFACVAVGLLIFMVLPMWQKYFSAKNWDVTPATVVWSQVRVHDGDDSDTYSADIFYSYDFHGKSYKSNTRGLMGSSSSSGRSGKQAIVKAHPSGKRIVCFVNPDNPHQTLLERDMGWWAAFTLFPLPFAGIGLGGLWFTFKKKKKAAKAVSSASKYRKSTTQADYTSSFRSNEAHVKFSPGKKRFYKAIGLLAMAVFWNGIVSVIYFTAAGAPVWFLAIFAIAGVGILLSFIYHLLLCFNPAPELTLVPGEIEIGSVALLKWSVKSGGDKLNHFAIYLVGEEEARYRRGTNTVTETEIFYEQALIDTTSSREVRVGTAEIELPLDTVPSWKSTNNAIKWSIRVRGDIPRWPDISDNYDITVTTPSNHE